MEEIYQEAFKIRSSEVTPEGVLKLHALCDMLQEVAGNNALELNFDITDLFNRDKTWVLQRLHLQVDNYPQWRETVTVKTWPSGGDRLRAFRDYRLIHSEGSEWGRGVSYWLMVDLKTKRPARIPDEIIDRNEQGVHTLPLRSERVRQPDNVEEWKRFRVRKDDLDINRHVNNVRYVSWINECISGKRSISEIDIEFLAESTLGDTNLAGTQNIGENSLGAVVKKEGDDKTLARARLTLD